MFIFKSSDGSFFEVIIFGLDEDLLSDDFVDLFDGGFRFGSRLVFVVIFYV